MSKCLPMFKEVFAILHILILCSRSQPGEGRQITKKLLLIIFFSRINMGLENPIAKRGAQNV